MAVVTWHAVHQWTYAQTLRYAAAIEQARVAAAAEREASLDAKPEAPRVRASPPSSGVDAHLWRIAACESGTDPTAVSPTGRYRGAWQFSLATYHAYGGVGDPVNASIDTQLVVARAVYAGQGPGAWPVCQHR